MNETESISPLAQLLRVQTELLTRRELRSAYRQDRDGTLSRLGLAAENVQQFPELNVEQLDAQAQALIEKRWHEVQKLIPIPQGADRQERHELFRDFAESYWPEGHHRHELDALAFARHLKSKRQHVAEEWRLNLLRFRVQKRRLAFHWVRSLPIRNCLCPGIQIIYQRGGSTGQFLIRLAI